MSVTPAFPLRRHQSLLVALATIVLASLVGATPASAAQGDGASSDRMPPVSSSTSDLAPGDPATITFTGGGWGHGAGMSQYGAYGRAAAGKSYKAILRFYYQGTRLAQTDYAGKVAVGITDRSAVVMRPRGRVDLRLNNAVKATARNGDVLRVSRTGNRWSLLVNNVEQCSGNCGGSSFALTYADGTIVGVDGANTYDHGKIRAVPNSSGRLDVVVADLTMDEYLYGLAEMPSSWPAEALKAQAVAGRSFAQHNIERRRADPNWTKPYDLASHTGDQVYAGRAKSAGSYGEYWVAAVDNTSGEISTHRGEPIQAFYSSSHGGHSADSEYVFVTELSYIRGRPDPFDGHENRFHTWTRTYSITQLSQWLSRYGAGTISSIEITGNIGVGGRVNRATAILRGSGGTKRITGNELRWRINEGVGPDLDRQLLGTKFDVSSTRPADEAPVGKWKFAEKVDSGPDAGVTLRGWALDPDTKRSIRVFLTDNGRWSGGQVANDHRPGIDADYGLGPKHGFELAHPLPPGVHELCVNARNHPDDTPVELQCRTVRVGTSPRGSITGVDSAVSAETPFEPARLSIAGQADDPDTVGAIDVEVRVGATTSTITAAGGRFTTDVTTGPGPIRVCATALDDSGLRPDTALGCVTHEVPDRSPVGKFTVSLPGDGQVGLRGWALDPDTDEAVRVRLLVDGAVTAQQVADSARPAIAATYGRGATHGFDLTATLAPGRYRLCVEAVDATHAAAAPVELACRNKTVS